MKLSFTILTILLFKNATFSQSSRQQKQLDSVFSMMNRQNQFNGTVLIAEKGKVIYHKGFGYRDTSSGSVNNKTTSYELASCSKQFTAAAIVLLHRDGLLNYEDRLSKHIPELSFWQEVTIYDLLRHTSGLPEYLIDMPKSWDHHKIATNDDLIKFYAQRKDTLEFKPGNRHRYNNTNYALLASIIERLSGKSYAGYLQERIFKPLHLNQTFVFNRRLQPRKLPNHAIGYVWAKNSFDLVSSENARYGDSMVYYLDGIVGNAKVNSTASEMNKWLIALNRNTLFTKDEFELMTTVSKTTAGKQIPYGFGLDLSKGTGTFSYGHTGSWDGYATFIYHNVIKDRSIITLQNFKMGAYPFDNINQILDGKPLTIEYRPKIQLSDDQIKRFAGEYVDEQNKNEVQVLTFLDGHLVHNSSRVRWDMRFFPVSASEFQAIRQGGADGVLKFTELSNGDTRLEMLQYGEVIGSGIKKKTVE
ncbi:beta-lactamase family protein [Mucilaginibacter sp. 21P]|uniref:serine hydrolase domain-containing protein n=1 Tax=Mucilaginibacter sp. 21P TaxID=2778902 RepID=UPI001C5772DC|nr:serine hydrolase domain-containing protein [Mucilaginibacter sp. 21P]QXV63799.1 beta-lactamase family protein [Mucilaginibacter sp. 21P]